MLEGISRLQQIQNSLKNRIECGDLVDQRTDHIKSLVDQFHRGSLSGETALKKSYKPLDYWYKIGPSHKAVGEKDLGEFEDVATAYLVYKLEESKRTSKKSANHTQLLGADYHPFGLEPDKSNDFTVRDDQIKSIVALLRKDHLQSPTGSGKSSVILPMASLVKALSENGRISVVSASDELTKDLEKTIREYNIFLPDEFQIAVSRNENETKKSVTKNEDKSTLVKALAREEIMDVESPLIGGTHLAALLNIPKDKPQNASQKAGIMIAKEDDFIFWKMRNPSEEVIHTYWDEIHVPYDRGSPYLLSGESLPTRLSVESYLYDRIVAGLVAGRTDTWEKYFGKFKEIAGRYDFNAYDKHHKVKDAQYISLQNEFYAEIKADWKNYNYKPDYERYIAPTIGELAKEFDVSEEKLSEWFQKQWENQPEEDRETAFTVDVLSVCRAKMMSEGSDWTAIDGKIVSRDPHMGIALPDRQYTPEILLALQSLEGTVDYASFIKTASEMTTLEGFIANNLKGMVTGLSGTLLTPTLTDSRPNKSPLARFLSRFTGHDVFSVEGAQKKYIPIPEYFIKDYEADESVISLLQNDIRGAALFTFNEEEGHRMAELIQNTYPDMKVMFVSDSLDEDAAKALYDMFANTNQRSALISTGRVGVGVDIKKSNGEHPDFLTIIKGLPYSEAQVFQTLGRRRRSITDPSRPEVDFAWVFSEPDLKNHSGLKFREEKEKETVIKHISEGGPHARQSKLKIIDDILHRAEAQQGENDVVRVKFDAFYPKARTSFELEKDKVGFEELLKKQKGNRNGIYEEEIRTKFNREEFRIIDQIAQAITYKQEGVPPVKRMFYGFVQTPGSLYYNLKSFLNNSQGETPEAKLASFYQEADRYLRQDELAEDWIRVRGNEFVDVTKHISAFFKANATVALEARGRDANKDLQKLGITTNVISCFLKKVSDAPFNDVAMEGGLGVEERVRQLDGSYALFFILDNPLTGGKSRYQAFLRNQTNIQLRNEVSPLKLTEKQRFVPVYSTEDSTLGLIYVD